MKRWVMVDNCIMEKTWVAEESAPLFSDLVANLNFRERAIDVSPGALNIEVVSELKKAESLYELANLIDEPEWARDHFKDLLKTRIECRRFDQTLAAVLVLKVLNRTPDQMLLSWYIERLDAATGEIIAISKRLVSLDLNTILISMK